MSKLFELFLVTLGVAIVGIVHIAYIVILYFIRKDEEKRKAAPVAAGTAKRNKEDE